MNEEPAPEADALFCARCVRELRPGAGDFFQVRIEAVADPWPPRLEGEAGPAKLRANIEQLMAELADYSEQEAMDQVYRRLVIYLCVGCFSPWIENPAT